MCIERIADYYERLTASKRIEIKKTNVPRATASTCQCTRLSLNECQNADDFQKLILYNCRDTVQRWAEAFKKLKDDNLQATGKTIKKGIISDIFSYSAPEERKGFVYNEFGNRTFGEKNKTVYEWYFQDNTLEHFELNDQVLGYLASSDNGLGNFTRNTIGNWLQGRTLPQDRNVIIRLAFWAKCTVEETNQLLECAGMHKLYLKGTGNVKDTRASLQDMVYIYMLKNQNYSFATAQEIIETLNDHFQAAIKQTLAHTPNSTSFHLQNLFNGLNNRQEELVEYFDQYLPDLLCAYTTLYGNLVELFSYKYLILKGNQNEEDFDSIHALTKSKFGNKWKESLKNTLYAAFKEDVSADPKKFKKKQLERIFHRNDIIVLGLILNSSRTEINNLLEFAQERPLYSRNFIECVIMNATENPNLDNTTQHIIEDFFTEDFQKYYQLSKKEFSFALCNYLRFYLNHAKYEYENFCFRAAINALLSLKNYEWIKHISVVKEVYPLNKQHVFEFKCLFRNAVKKKREIYKKNKKMNPKDMPEPTETTEKVIHLKKIQIVRPIAYCYSKEFLSWYPEKALFEFLVSKTSSYLKNKTLCSYLRKEG